MIFFPVFFRGKPATATEKPLDIQITDAQIEWQKTQLEFNAETARQITQLKERVEALEKANPSTHSQISRS